MRSFAFVVGFVAFSTSARAGEICFEQQVCEEVCTEVIYEVSDEELSYASRSSGSRSLDLPQSCETVCTFEEFCYPVDTTNGGQGNSYNTDDVDACYAEELLVDQIRCIAMLGA